MTYSYDGNGSTIAKTENGLTSTYVWNDDKRLVSATVNGTAISYTYNDQGIRTSSTVDGVEMRYLLDEGIAANVWEEYSPNGTVQASYVYGYDLISQVRSGVSSFYLVDGLGSTRLLTDGQGQVVNAYGYEAFGETVSHSGTATNAYQYAGEQFDGETGDYYLRQRFYDTSSGRFGRMDTYEGRLNEPLTLHKYIYANDNPINSIDPTGLFTMVEIGAADSIRNILMGIHIDNGQRLIGVVLGERPDPRDFVIQGLLGLGILASIPLATRFLKDAFILRALTQRYKFFAGNEAFNHFVTHGDEVMHVLGRTSYNIKDYIEDANHVIKTGRWVPEMNGYVKIVGGSGKSAKAAFVGVRRDNANVVTTFHIKSVKEISKKSPSLGWN